MTSPIAVLLIIGSAVVGASAQAQEIGPATLTPEGIALCAKYKVDCTKDYPWRADGRTGASSLMWPGTASRDFDFMCGNCRAPFTSAYREPATCILVETQPAVWGTITQFMCKLNKPRERKVDVSSCTIGEECS